MKVSLIHPEVPYTLLLVCMIMKLDQTLAISASFVKCLAHQSCHHHFSCSTFVCFCSWLEAALEQQRSVDVEQTAGLDGALQVEQSPTYLLDGWLGSARPRRATW